MSTENSELIMHHYLDLDSASDWSCCMGNLRQLINQKHYTDLGSDSHQYGIFALGGGNQWWPHEMLALFSGFLFTIHS